MNQDEIKDRIDYLNTLIEKSTDTCSFVLNKEVKEYIEEIESIQSKCNHKFENNICCYCYKEENN